VLLTKWLGEGEVQEMEERAVSKIEGMDDPGVQVGWPMWVRVGCLVERQYDLPRLLRAMQSLSIWFNYDELEEDGKCSSATVSSVFDWGLAGLLQDLPPRDDAAQSLLDVLDPEDDEWIDVSLAVAARMALPTGNWWPVQGGGGVAGFVAKLLSLIEECGEPTPQQQSRAVQVALRLWSWAMPKREQLQEQCEVRRSGVRWGAVWCVWGRWGADEVGVCGVNEKRRHIQPGGIEAVDLGHAQEGAAAGAVRDGGGADGGVASVRLGHLAIRGLRRNGSRALSPGPSSPPLNSTSFSNTGRQLHCESGRWLHRKRNRVLEVLVILKRFVSLPAPAVQLRLTK
ncbi:unnamed protein product, partial [Closterium sp. NIES-54]